MRFTKKEFFKEKFCQARAHAEQGNRAIRSLETDAHRAFRDFQSN